MTPGPTTTEPSGDDATDLRAIAFSGFLHEADAGALFTAADELDRLHRRVVELEAMRVVQLEAMLPDSTQSSMFAEELAAYAVAKPDLLIAYEGWYIVVKGEQILGPVMTYDDALRVGYEAFGLMPFLVKKIEAVERILYMRPG